MADLDVSEEDLEAELQKISGTRAKKRQKKLTDVLKDLASEPNKEEQCYLWSSEEREVVRMFFGIKSATKVAEAVNKLREARGYTGVKVNYQSMRSFVRRQGWKSSTPVEERK